MAPTKPLVAQHMSSFFSVFNIPEDAIAVVTGKNLPPIRMAIWNRKEIRLVFAMPEVVKNDLADGVDAIVADPVVGWSLGLGRLGLDASVEDD